MELFNRMLVLAAYVVVGCIIGISAWVAGLYYANSHRAAFNHYLDDLNADQPMRLAHAGDPTPGMHVEHLFAQRAQIERLQAALAQKDALLDRKRQLLEQKTVDQQTLKQELESAITVLEMLAAQAMLAESVPDDPNHKPLNAELERLQEERNRNQALAQQLQQDLQELAAELAVTDDRIRHLQQQAEFETTVLLAEMETFQSVASRALAGLGGESVGALVDLLADPRPRIRRWAVGVLAEIGPPAQEAIPALVDIMSDPDPLVREEVRRALDNIQPMEQE
jgi:HEAT repeat protein